MFGIHLRGSSLKERPHIPSRSICSFYRTAPKLDYAQIGLQIFPEN